MNDRRRKTGKAPSSISADHAWFHYAKLRFPDEKVWGITSRDYYLIERYQDPSEPAPYSPPFAWPDDSFAALDRVETRPPPSAQLVPEVSRAYYRLWMQQQVDAWFKAKRFDLSKPTIPKHRFEAAVQAEFGQSAKVEQPPPKPTKPLKKHQRYPDDDPLVAEAVRGLEENDFPNIWQAAKAVAPRAKGEMPAKLHRLNRKIDEAYNLKLKTNKTNQKI